VISDGTVAEPIEDELKNQNYSDLPDFSSNPGNFPRYPYHVKGIGTLGAICFSRPYPIREAQIYQRESLGKRCSLKLGEQLSIASADLNQPMRGRIKEKSWP